jgi:branched-subunit amino acid aminotransferase/4-amino-4-deoxychorismate lyase
LHDTQPGATASAWLTAQALAGEVASVKVVALPFVRNENSALKGLKCTSYAENLLGLRWAREHGADEGIFFNTRDELCEACTANVFVKIDGHWLTPSLDSGCLPGVMREFILERDASIRESVITRAEFARAEEMFLTSAIRGVVPVTSCDARVF